MQSESKRTWTKPWSTPMADVSGCLLTFFSTLILLAHQIAASAGPTQSITGMLYAENFTYYKLSGEGWLRLELHSLKGDVDLYVSGHTLTPSFIEYELKSESCGVDVVDIHSSVNRPVGIGIYAHPFYLQSEFRMDIWIVKEVEADEYELLFRAFHFYDYDETSSKEESGAKINRKSKALTDSEDEEQESIWWNILITMLKFILEVIM